VSRDQALEELKQGLRELLSLLDGEESSTAAVLRAVADCDERMAQLKAQPVPTAATPEEQAAFTRSMEEALRLNSVARSIVESQGAQLIQRLEQARGLRRGLSGSHSGKAGRSVDVSG